MVFLSPVYHRDPLHQFSTTSISDSLASLIENHMNSILLPKRRLSSNDVTIHPLSKIVSKFSNLFVALYSATPEMTAFTLKYCNLNIHEQVVLSLEDLTFCKKMGLLLDSAIADIGSFLNKMQQTILSVFPQLNFKLGRELSRSSIQNILLPMNYPILLELYNLKFFEPNLRFRIQLASLQFISPTDLGVSTTFSLIETDAICLLKESLCTPVRSIDDIVVKTTVKKKNQPGRKDSSIGIPSVKLDFDDNTTERNASQDNILLVAESTDISRNSSESISLVSSNFEFLPPYQMAIEKLISIR